MKFTFEDHSRKRLRYITLWLVFISLFGKVYAQEQPKSSINQIISAVNTFTNRAAVEKLYLQTDRAVYATGDTLWFKGYLFDASYLNATTKSGVLYVEIANDSNKVVKRIMLPLLHGLAIGQVALDKNEMHQGAYMLRAYTNWMRNFGEDYVFKKRFYINELTGQDWLINYHAESLQNAKNDLLQLNLRFSRLDKTAIGLREVQVTVMDGQRTLYKKNVTTSVDGLLAADLDLSKTTDTKKLALILQDRRKGEEAPRLVMPLLFNRPEKIDLQFMPEGGHLVAGLPAHVAFKTLNEDGLGVEVSGKVYNSKGQEVVGFHSTHKGIGTFDFVFQANESYSAKIKLPNGESKPYLLPAILQTGTVLHVENPMGANSFEVVINATPDIAAREGIYYLIGQARGVVACYGAAFNFRKGTVRLKVDKATFPSGIVRFTLVGPGKTALNERIIYIDHADNLNIQLNTDKIAYHQRDSVTLDIQVSDKSGNPVQGSFSLSVTDDGFVKTDSLIDGTIVSHMLLGADLKGEIEAPGYYEYPSKSIKVWQDLDQLILAQGWIGYDWSDVFDPAKVYTYSLDNEFIITGNVTNAFNKPIAGTTVALLLRKPLVVKDTVTDAAGAFVFKDVIPLDTPAFFIQARNRRGKSFNVGIEMNEFKAPVFKPTDEHTLPWYANIDTNRLSSVRHQIQLRKEQIRITDGVLLKDVVVTAKRIVKDSKNLNGPGEADIIIGEEELGKKGRTTLGELLEENVKGFHVWSDKYGNRYFRIDDRFVHLIIDGMDTEFFRPENTSLYEFFKEYFDYYDAEEIKGIEVMTTSKNTGRYWSDFLDPLKTKSYEHCFIEITTRGGKGPFVKKSVGTYLYKPLPFTLPQKFYSPKYTTSSIADMTDIRPTVFWEPNIITDEEGKASLGFYTADSFGSYSVIIEGSDMEGKLGVKRMKITIEK